MSAFGGKLGVVVNELHSLESLVVCEDEVRMHCHGVTDEVEDGGYHGRAAAEGRAGHRRRRGRRQGRNVSLKDAFLLVVLAMGVQRPRVSGEMPKCSE